MELVHLIEEWLKTKSLDWALDWAYPVPALRQRIEGRDWWGYLVCIIASDRIYIDAQLWDGDPFDRVLLANDPEFFNKLEAILSKHAPVV